MIYLAVDTCVWLELLKTDFNQDDNYFDELIFWIENDYLKLVTTENLITEWNRNKVSKRDEVLQTFKVRYPQIARMMSTPHPLADYYRPERAAEKITERINKIDTILNRKADKAIQTDDIILEAAKRNLECIPPNHRKDSFRDTINILTLKEYVILNGYSNCIFTTINHKDYGDKDPYKVHPGLKSDFISWKMEYVYFDDKDNFSGTLFTVHLRPHLPSFADFIRDQKRKEEEARLVRRKLDSASKDHIDPNYLDYTLKIDAIVDAGEKRTKLDDYILEFLFDEHPAYKEYFYRKITRL
jgi:hypothetical protein